MNEQNSYQPPSYYWVQLIPRSLFPLLYFDFKQPKRLFPLNLQFIDNLFRDYGFLRLHYVQCSASIFQGWAVALLDQLKRLLSAAFFRDCNWHWCPFAIHLFDNCSRLHSFNQSLMRVMNQLSRWQLTRAFLFLDPFTWKVKITSLSPRNCAFSKLTN